MNRPTVKKVAVFAVQNRLFNQTYFYYGYYLYRRAGMNIARRKTEIPDRRSTQGTEAVQSQNLGQLNGQSGCLPDAPHYQTDPANLS